MNGSKFSSLSRGLDCSTTLTGYANLRTHVSHLMTIQKILSERELKLLELLLESVPERRLSHTLCRIIELNRRTYGAASHLNIVHEFMVQISRQVLLAGRSAEIGYGY